MPGSQVVLHRNLSKLDSSLRQKAFGFLQKLIENDASPGLHIEPIKNCADKRVRTGRVDKQYRAVLFKLNDDDGTTYLLHGIWNHDDAIREAARAILRINPVNGITEIIRNEEPDLPATPDPWATQSQQQVDTGDTGPASPAEDAPTPAPEVPASTETAPAPSEEVLPRRAAPVPPQPSPGRRPLIDLDPSLLIDELGMDKATARRAVTLTEDDDLEKLAHAQPGWQCDALLELATGSSLDEVRESLQLKVLPTQPRQEDADILASLDHPASRMQFARVEGIEELRRVIEEGSFGEWRVFLHPTQRKWVERHWNGAFRLAGGAGTGKTVVALHRARMLAKANPQARIVLTTFTVNLAQELKRSMERLDPTIPQVGLGESGVHICSLDSLAIDVLKRSSAVRPKVENGLLGRRSIDIFSRPPSRQWDDAIRHAPDLPQKLANPNFLASEYRMVILPEGITTREEYLRVRRPGRGVALSRKQRNAVWDAVEAYRDLSRTTSDCIDWNEVPRFAAACLHEVPNRRYADHVIVDEGQDLSPSHWLMVRELVDEGPDDIFIAEDTHQRIYGSRLVLSHYGIATRGRSQKLTLNYRTTQENLRWATSVLDGGDYVDLDAEPDSTDRYRSARSGPAPVIHPCDSLTEELDFTAETIRRWVAEDRASGRTTPVAVLVRDARRRGIVARGLEEREVPIRAVDREPVQGDGPVVMTMHRAKGTEFTRVILFEVSEASTGVGLHNHDYSEADQADAMLRERSLLYVAASRARDELVITWAGRASSLLGD